jgi:hypothetical protein
MNSIRVITAQHKPSFIRRAFISGPSILLLLALLLFQVQTTSLNDTTYGSIRLAAGFSDDPYIASITSGGGINASSFGSDCTGFIGELPDFRLFWSGKTSELRLFFEADYDFEDSTIIVKLPNGQFLCNDDFSDEGLDPMVIITGASTGTYDIWVGSYEEEDYIDGQLYITERPIQPGYGRQNTASSNSLNFLGDPTYGTIDLAEYFTPDPAEYRGTSGGVVDVSELNLGPDCIGHSSVNPDFRLNWSGSTQDLYIYFVSDDPEVDTTIIVNTSDGSWVCNDDASYDTLNPGLSLKNFPEGQFDIWIGSYSSGEYVEGSLIITELDPF